MLPATLLETPGSAVRVLRFWALGLVGSLAGALLVGALVAFAQHYPASVEALLTELVESKMRYRADGGATAWGRVVVSGMLANWLVGMAAFFAFMGRTIVGKYVPVALAVTMFVAAGFQHSPANMGYFALLMAQGQGPGWGPALAWNIVPAGLGNMLVGALLVAVPFWYAFRPSASSTSATGAADRPGRDG